MPKIINAYSDGNGSIADSLKSIGESIWGNEARNEGQRQNALKLQRENSARDLGAAALSRGDTTDLLAQGFRSGPGAGQDTSNYIRALYAQKYGINSPQFENAAGGAGEAYHNLPSGYREGLANQRTIESMRATRAAEAQAAASDRAAQTQEAIAQRQLEADQRKNENTPVTIYDNGQPMITRQAQAYGHAGAPLHKDQVIGGILQNSFTPQSTPPEAQGTDAVSAPPPMPPGSSPFTNLSPDVRHLAGLPTGLQQFMDPNSRQVYLSNDGGQTVTVGNHRIPVQGSGLHPISNEQAVTQTQDNMTRGTAGQPLQPPPGQYSQAALDAGTTSGLKSPLQHELNATAGALGLGEVQPNTNRARENLDQLTQSTRALIAAAPGRTALTDRRWADELLPQPGWFGMTGINAAQQQNRVVSLTQHLRQVFGDVQQEATDLNTPPAQRAQMLQYLQHLGQAIRMWEAPPTAGAAPGGAAQPGGAPAPTAGARPRAHNKQTGQVIEWNGQAWTPVQ